MTRADTLSPSILNVVNFTLDDIGYLIRNHQQQLAEAGTPLTVQTKRTPVDGGRVAASPVTPVDITVQRVLIGRLTALFGPNLAIYAEEEGFDDPAALTAEVCAVIDPIDQTRCLLAGRPRWSINLAIIMGAGGMVYGWMDVPATGWRVTSGPDGIVSNNVLLAPVRARDDAVMIAVTRQDYHHLPAELGGRPVYPVVSSGIAYRLAMVPTGQADAMFALPHPERGGIGLWDYLPVAAGLRHLGLEVQGLSGGEDLAALRPPRWDGGIVAGPPDVCELLRAALAGTVADTYTSAGEPQPTTT